MYPGVDRLYELHGEEAVAMDTRRYDRIHPTDDSISVPLSALRLPETLSEHYSFYKRIFPGIDEYYHLANEGSLVRILNSLDDYSAGTTPGIVTLILPKFVSNADEQGYTKLFPQMFIKYYKPYYSNAPSASVSGHGSRNARYLEGYVRNEGAPIVVRVNPDELKMPEKDESTYLLKNIFPDIDTYITSTQAFNAASGAGGNRSTTSVTRATINAAASGAGGNRSTTSVTRAMNNAAASGAGGNRSTTSVTRAMINAAANAASGAGGNRSGPSVMSASNTAGGAASVTVGTSYMTKSKDGIISHLPKIIINGDTYTLLGKLTEIIPLGAVSKTYRFEKIILMDTNIDIFKTIKPAPPEATGGGYRKQRRTRTKQRRIRTKQRRTHRH